jgi:surface protein
VRIGRGYECVHQCAMVMDRLCARALAGSCCGLGLQPEPLNRASPCPSAWTACGFGAQAFQSASAFNADIGVWNTARVTTLSQVCAAPGPAARTMADALGRASVRRGRLCAAAPPMRARVRTRAGTRLRGAVGVGTAARRGGSVHASECIYIYVCVCVLYVHTYIIHLSVYVRIGRGDVCVHQCAMVMDRLCAHALAGSCCGLGLKPETLNRASPCPSAWTACGFGAQAFYGASAFNANIGGWNTAAVTTLFYVCAAPGPAARTNGGTRSAGLRCGAAGCARRHRRCARVCAHVQALACAGPWV